MFINHNKTKKKMGITEYVKLCKTHIYFLVEKLLRMSFLIKLINTECNFN
jgi:hypothetical protein